MYASDFCIWKPDADNLTSSPKLEFCDPLFKRRFSQITKMTIQVLHDLIEKRPDLKDVKIFFTSFRGEIKREFTINEGLIEEGMILPAGFSLSVFNTPISSATIALKMTGGYQVVFPSEGRFDFALEAAASAVKCGDEKEVIFVYADEKIPEEYNDVIKKSRHESTDNPMAFACVISNECGEDSIKLEDLPSKFNTF